MKGNTVFVRKLSERENLFSLGFVYVAVVRTAKYKQAHYFESLSELMQFVQDTLRDS